MKLFKLLLITSIVISEHLNANEITFQKGTHVTIANMDNIAATSVPYAVARNNIIESGDSGVQSFLETSDKKLWALSRSNKIHLSDMESEDHLGSWPFGASDPCENSTNPDCAYPWWVGRWGEDEVLEPEIRGNYQPGEMGWDQGLDTDDTIMGCMGRAPLRYGDIEGDNKKELAIFLLNGYSLDFVIFSPEKNKNIFTSKLEFNDALKHEAIFVADGSNDYMLPDESLPYYQYWSRSGYDTGSGSGLSQAFRGFAKLYVGHFESAQSNDILVWRKAYKSRLLTDSVKGFEKTGDNYIHYKLINGEYKKQPTEQAVVKGWLADKNLTWQKGYPSKSECPGQEGQLIPEMHDPLLNDPDVLK